MKKNKENIGSSLRTQYIWHYVSRVKEAIIDIDYKTL